MDSLNFKRNNIEFDVYRAKCKHFHEILLTVKAKLPNMYKKLISVLTSQIRWRKYTHFHKPFRVKRIFDPFQYRVLNYILCTNSKLFEIDLSLNDKCNFCSSAKEELYQLFFECSHAQIFWKAFSSLWFEFVEENITVSFKYTILGLLNRTDIINYLLIFGKLCIWECRKAGIFPDCSIFLKKTKNEI